MPLGRLSAAAADAAALSLHMGEDPRLHHSDALVQEMLAWFKAGFFTWVRHRLMRGSLCGNECSDISPMSCRCLVLQLMLCAQQFHGTWLTYCHSPAAAAFHTYSMTNRTGRTMMAHAAAQVDSPACERCGSRDTFNTGTEAPSPAEAADGSAGRTEVYRCAACSAVVRWVLSKVKGGGSSVRAADAVVIQGLCAFKVPLCSSHRVCAPEVW